ncbi:chitin deacetylase [Chitinispirillum alkaliphilum]|nr:chitin deacetylase [Chitinispirillum alkaliphilum]
MNLFRKYVTVTLFSAGLALAGQGVGVYDYSDNMPPSRTHPSSESIPVEQVPMFISFGFDDNGINIPGQGVDWILNYLRDKTNPGTGNPGTYDGAPMRASFYVTSKYGKQWVYHNYPAIRQGWRALYEDGHEIGNHSDIHLGYWDNDLQKFFEFKGYDYTKEQWLAEELDPCHEFLIKPYGMNAQAHGLGMEESDIYGWRTPRLEWNNAVFEALVERGYVYDCSINSESDNDGTSNYWPFTMDEGHPFIDSVASFPGFWQLPCYQFMIPPNLQDKVGTASMTGLDYNVWARTDLGGKELTAAEFTRILKHTLDLRMAGNRAPMLIGLHSDIYSEQKDSDYPASGTYRDRQLAIERFVDYALETYPEVRFVPAIDVINWMRNPVSLSGELSVNTEKKTLKTICQ